MGFAAVSSDLAVLGQYSRVEFFDTDPCYNYSGSVRYFPSSYFFLTLFTSTSFSSQLRSLAECGLHEKEVIIS